MSDFYNEAIKNLYLNSLENDNTRETIAFVFKSARTTEELLERDLYNFSKDEIGLVLKNIHMTSYNTVRANANYISGYITFCIARGYRENNLNPLDTADRKWMMKFVDRTVKIHYSDEELEDLIEEFDNAQDQALVQLWFEGVGGRKDFAEIRNLHYYDINWSTNELELTDYDGTKRTLIVSDRCMMYLQNANKQTTYLTYINKDGEIRGNEKPLCKTDFIFKNIDSRRTKEKVVGVQVIYKRLFNIKDRFRLDYFTQNSIRQSGALYMAYQLYLRDGKLEKEQLYEIGRRFNFSTVENQNQGYEYPNVTLMKNFITSENLKELYDIDVEIKIRKVNRKPK